MTVAGRAWRWLVGLGSANLQICFGGGVLLILLIVILLTIGTPTRLYVNLNALGLPPSCPIARELLDLRPEPYHGEPMDGAPRASPEPPIYESDDFLPNGTKPTRDSESAGYFLLGTDKMGRDVLKIMALGSRTVLLPGVLASLISMVLGVFMGLGESFSATRWLETASRTGRLIVGSLPKFLVLLVVLAAGGGSLGMISFAVAVGVLGGSRVAEAVRGQVAVLRQSDFLESCREMGVSRFRVMRKHLLMGASFGLLAGQFFFGVAEAVLLEAMMAVIGRSLSGLNDASWTSLLAREFARIQELILWSSVPPALAIVGVILALTLLGAGITRKLYISRLRESAE